MLTTMYYFDAYIVVSIESLTKVILLFVFMLLNIYICDKIIFPNVVLIAQKSVDSMMDLIVKLVAGAILINFTNNNKNREL